MRETVVSTSAWAVHRNKDIYGEDVEKFRPERWNEEKKAGMRMVSLCVTLQTMNLTWTTDGLFFTFGMGARTCIGKSELLTRAKRKTLADYEQISAGWKCPR